MANLRAKLDAFRRNAHLDYVAKRWAEFGPKIIIASDKVHRQYRIYHAYTPEDELRILGQAALETAIRYHSGQNGVSIICTRDAAEIPDAGAWYRNRWAILHDLCNEGGDGIKWCVYVQPFVYMMRTVAVLRNIAQIFAQCETPYTGDDMDETITILTSGAVSAADNMTEPREICAD